MADQFADHFSAQAGIYAEFRPQYPLGLFEWLSGLCAHHHLCWDAATGNGQAAVALAAFFEKVYASDASAAQVREAIGRPNIEYAVEGAERTRLPDHTADLVTVAQAYHWFRHDVFHAEVARVLKPGGLLAVWGYGLQAVAPSIDQLVRHYYEDIVGTYWPPERRHVENAYRDISFPFAAMETPKFEIKVEYSLAEFVGYLRSWSATQRRLRETGQDPVSLIQDKLLATWGPVEKREVRWPIFIRVGRR